MPGAFLRLGIILAVVLVSGCSAGVRSIRFVTPELSDAYIPLYAFTTRGNIRFAAAVVVAPNVAVTNDHNLNLVSAETVLARSPAYDLLFFRTERARVPPIASPMIGQPVIAYGQDGKSNRREAKGTVRQLDARAFPLCADCPERPAITYDAEAGQGFSGGPVVDVASGAVVAITVGYLDGAAEDGGRRMYAVSMDFVLDELRRLLPGAGNQNAELGSRN